MHCDEYGHNAGKVLYIGSKPEGGRLFDMKVESSFVFLRTYYA